MSAARFLRALRALTIPWEDFKAWRRAEKRVAPRGARGRIYARKALAAAAEPPHLKIGARGAPSVPGRPGNVMAARRVGVARIRPRRVFRARDGEWHDLAPDGRPNGREREQ